MNKYLFNIYLFLKYKKKGYPTSPKKLFKELQKSQYWSREEIENYQLEKLNDLLIFSKKHSEYYAKSLKGIDLPLASIDDFKKIIPLIRKGDIIENLDDLKTSKFTENYLHSTSGSSGDPLSTYISGRSEAYRKACVLRFHNSWGINAKDKSVLIWRVHFSESGSVFSKIKKYMKRRYDINIFSLNEKTIFKYCYDIEKFKPSFIRGYKSGILEFAELMESNNLTFKSFKLKVAIVTGEVLTTQERRTIERILKCKVANEYGSADAGFIGYECDKGSMHINDESVMIYTDSYDSAIVTELHNDSMPYINYLNDDIIQISESYCTCGRTSRLIKNIVGRDSGYILKPDGSKINQFILLVIFYEIHTLKDNNPVRKFKVFQSGNKFRIEIVPLENFNDRCSIYIRKRMVEEIGDSIEVEFKLVEDIPRDKSGKLKYFERES